MEGRNKAQSSKRNKGRGSKMAPKTAANATTTSSKKSSKHKDTEPSGRRTVSPTESVESTTGSILSQSSATSSVVPSGSEDSNGRKSTDILEEKGPMPEYQYTRVSSLFFEKKKLVNNSFRPIYLILQAIFFRIV